MHQTHASIDVWSTPIATDTAFDPAALAILDHDERERAASFKQEAARTRYIASHLLLRLAISATLGCEPGQVRVTYDGGRPVLEAPQARLGLSLTRTEGMVACALGDCAALGVDLERIQELPDLEQLLPHVLSGEELQNWPPGWASSGAEAFFPVWCRKEALGKARGTGLEAGVSALRVPMQAPASTQWRLIERVENGAMLLTDLVTGPRYRGALVVQTAQDAETHGPCMAEPSPRSLRLPWGIAADRTRYRFIQGK